MLETCRRKKTNERLFLKASFFRSYGRPEVLEYGDCRTRRRPRARWWSTSTPPASTPPTGRCAPGSTARQIELPARAGPRLLGRGRRRWARARTISRSATRCSGVCEVPREGAYAEKIAIRQEIVARKPEKLEPCAVRGDRARRAHGADLARGNAQAQGGRDHPDPGRRRRGCRLRHRARQAPRRARHHHRERGEPRVRAQARRRPGDRLPRAGLHQARLRLSTRCSTPWAAT